MIITKSARTFGRIADISHGFDKLWFQQRLPTAFWAYIATRGNLCFPLACDRVAGIRGSHSLLSCIPGGYYCP